MWVCRWMTLKDGIQTLRQFFFSFFFFWVVRGSVIRGATKSFLTLTHCVACLLNRVTFFGVFLESDSGRVMERRTVEFTRVSLWQKGRKKKWGGRQKEQQMKRETSKGQVFERGRKYVWQTIPGLSLSLSYFTTSLKERKKHLFSFLCHADCWSCLCLPSPLT